jgi:RimJ/RimL family protein N-acetyltransferase
MTARKIVQSDLDSLCRILCDEETMRYYPKVMTREEAQGWLDKILTRYEEFGYAFWAWELKSSGEFVGQCGLLPQVVDGVLEMEVGYLFVREHWHKGYATEAARASRDYGFHNYPVPHIISLIVQENSPSIRVAQRNGMSFDRGTTYKGSPHGVYKITREEWKKL